MNRIPMTPQGEAALKEELHYLKGEKRQVIIQAIAEARAHGDLKENAEYHAAKELQGLTEARIRDLEHQLAYAQVIDVTQLPNQGRVIFGVTVTLLNIGNEEAIIYRIVGEEEADIKSGKLAVTAPIARSLIGKCEEDIVEIVTPKGKITYEIIKIEHL
ncbi:MAG TPA: transcription elongation factor GreA [Coxiellaceae bacterium]|nr:transcription elongation factor GreA [Coxiellaceae bacterium]